MKSIISIIFSIVIGLTSVSCEAGPKERKLDGQGSGSAVEHNSSENSSESVPVKSDASLLYLLVFSSLGLNAVLIGACVVVYWKHKFYLRNEVVSIVTSSDRLSVFRGQNKQHDSMPSDLKISSVAEAVINRNMDTIVDRVRECIRLDYKEQQEAQVKFRIESDLYASSADKSDSTFYEVTECMDNDSLYSLRVTGIRAEFEVLDSVVSRVLANPDKLTCACDVRGQGSNEVITKSKGIAEKQPNGKWKVMTPAIVEIN